MLSAPTSCPSFVRGDVACKINVKRTLVETGDFCVDDRARFGNHMGAQRVLGILGGRNGTVKRLEPGTEQSFNALNVHVDFTVQVLIDPASNVDALT